MADGNPRRIDVHHHIFPPTYKTRAGDRVRAGSSVDHSTLFDWTPEVALALMDRFGVDQDGSLREIEYAFDTLKADGIGILTSYGDKWPGDPAFAPVFDELNRRKSVVFVHPTVPGCCVGIIPGIPPAITEFLFDTTRAITSLLVNGTFARCPNIRFIFCHAGGTAMPIAHRINGWSQRSPQAAKLSPGGALEAMKRLYYDIATSTNPASISALRAIVPLTQILFGSDNPFVAMSVTATGMDAFGFSDDDARAINRENALRLFPRLRD